MTCMYETDAQGKTLIVGGWMGSLWANDDGYLMIDCNDNVLHEKLTGQEALAFYNEINGTKLDASFFDMWLTYYRALDKNPLTGTRVSKDHPAYWQYQGLSEEEALAKVDEIKAQSQRVRDWMKTHPELVEKVRAKNGL